MLDQIDDGIQCSSVFSSSSGSVRCQQQCQCQPKDDFSEVKRAEGDGRRRMVTMTK